MYLTYFNLLMYNYLFDIDIYSVYVKRLSKETKREKVNGFFHDIITQPFLQHLARWRVMETWHLSWDFPALVCKIKEFGTLDLLHDTLAGSVWDWLRECIPLGKKARTFDLDAIFEQTRRTAIERSQRVLGMEPVCLFF